MRLATYNVENLFSRAKAFNLDDWQDGEQILDQFAELNALLQKQQYSTPDKQRMVEFLIALGLEDSDDGPFVILRQNRARLLRRPKEGGVVIIAEGREDWVGWLELKRQAVNQIAVLNTGRVVRDVGADVLAVVEAEDRTALRQFNRQVLASNEVGGIAYSHVMLIDGNDERGIDVSVMTKAGYEIVDMRSHVDDVDENGALIFSRDCPEYRIRTPSGISFRLLINHFKSKGYGNPRESDKRRWRQAERVRAIYRTLREQGENRIAIAGDLNDHPGSGPLDPLLANGSDLQDISRHPLYQDDGHPGTFGNGTANNKFDYLLLSPALFAAVKAGGVNRTGVWSGKNGTLWNRLPELRQPSQAASDHAAVWADLDL